MEIKIINFKKYALARRGIVSLNLAFAKNYVARRSSCISNQFYNIPVMAFSSAVRGFVCDCSFSDSKLVGFLIIAKISENYSRVFLF